MSLHCQCRSVKEVLPVANIRLRCPVFSMMKTDIISTRKDSSQLKLPDSGHGHLFNTYVKYMLITCKFISYMAFTCDDVPHCCKGTHAKTKQVKITHDVRKIQVYLCGKETIVDERILFGKSNY